MTWTAPAITRPDGPLTGAERPMLEGFLAWQRSTLLTKCAGLTGEQLAQRANPPSGLSLLGLVRHMAKVERAWFRERVAGEAVEPIYDPALGKDADFDDVDPSLAEQDYERLVRECEAVDAAVADVDLDSRFVHHGEEHSLRLVYLHMIEEYARHNGHADLLRERIDGVTGE
ncbi:MAG: DinB family protein [Nocardioidaceae bacterium]